MSGIKGYNVWLGGQRINEQLLPDPTFTLNGLNSDSLYAVTVSAVDLAGNEGPQTPVYSFRTLALPPINTGSVTPDKASAIDALVLADMAKNKQTGTILHVTGPAGSYLKAYGKTGANGRAVTVDDHVRIGSNTKMFIALATLMELDKGSFDLRDKVSEYVPNVTNGDKITIDNLLTMRAGLSEFWSWNNPYIMFLLGVFPTGPFSAAQCEAAARSAPSKFEPGTKFEYSNSNAVVAGMVVEAVSGLSIRNYLIERIIKPLGLTETTWPLNSTLPAPAMLASAFNPEIAGAAGALTSTINDMTKFAMELRDGTLLSQESHWYWLNTFYNIGEGTLWKQPPVTLGYGNFMFKFGRWMGHGGSIPTGFDSGVLFDPVSKATITIVNNAQIATAPGFYSVSHDIATLLYPGSMNEPTYDATPGQRFFPKPALLKMATFAPMVAVNARNPQITPTPAALQIVGGVPGANPIAPTTRELLAVGKVPVVKVEGPPTSFDSAGTGTYSNGGQWSYKHTAAKGAYVLCVVVTDRTNPVTDVTYNGVAMKLIATMTHSNNNNGVGSTYVFGIADVDAGTATVVVTSTGGGTCLSNTFGYNGVGSASFLSSTAGNSLPISHPVACASPQRVFEVIANSSSGLYPGAALMTPSGGTVRSNTAVTGSLAAAISDTDVDATFEASSSASYYWSALAISLRPGFNAKPTGMQLALAGGIPVVETPVVGRPASAALALSMGTPNVVVKSLFGFDAVSVAAGGYAASLTWKHTTEAGCYVIVDVAMGNTSTVVKYAGVQMTLLGNVSFNNGAGGYGLIRRYGLPNAPGGESTITVKSAAFAEHQAAAVSYRGVTSVSTVAGATGSSNNLAQQADLPSGSRLLVQAFGGYTGNGGTLTGFQGGVNRMTAGGANRLAINESDVSTTFLASDPWPLAWASIFSVLS